MNFYDTNSLLRELNHILLTPFAISNISLQELENIKTSPFKDEETKYRARKVLHLLEENEDKYDIVFYNKELHNEYYLKYYSDFDETNDIKIICCAKFLQECGRNVTFFTCDLSCKQIAKMYLYTQMVIEDYSDDYTGYEEINLNTEEEVSNFYSALAYEHPEYLNNEYIIVKQNNEVIDKYKNDLGTLIQVHYPCFNSKLFGKTKPKDEYQFAAMDSMLHNKITLIRGMAGSGKSYLALSFLFDQLEHGKIDKIIIFCNPVATKDSCKFGFLPGDATEKILGSQIGNFLISKIGDRAYIEQMIEEGTLVLMPVADCRGYDTTGMRAGIYITEAQNTTIDIMKLILQRIGEDSVCVIDGDDSAQVDMSVYAGANNGLRRLSQVFRGDECYGEVTLKNCYRSHIAEIAEKM